MCMEASGTEDAFSRSTRLSRNERLFVGLVIALALAAVAAAMLSSLSFGSPSLRDESLAGQSGKVILWALATPFCAWAVLRGGRRGGIAVVVWLGMLAWCSPWWWPARSIDIFDRGQPIWYGAGRSFPWALAISGLGVGVFAAWRARRWPGLIGAGIVAAILTGVGVMSYMNLERHARPEEAGTAPSAEGVAELRTLKRDLLWASLPQAEVRDRDEHALAAADIGEGNPTSVTVRLGDSHNIALFRRAAAAAEKASWTLRWSSCSDSTGGPSDAIIKGYFGKMLATGPAILRIETAPDIAGVELFAEMSDSSRSSTRDRCWE